MRKFICLLILSLSFNYPAFSEEASFEDLARTDFSHTTQNLKHFSDKEFENAIQQYKNNFHKPKKVRKKDIKTPTSVQGDSDFIGSEFEVLKEVINHTPVIMIPADCISSDGQEIQAGHYSMSVKFDSENRPFIYLSQGNYKSIKIPAVNSAQNEYEDTINYGYALGKGNVVKLLYGNVDIAVEASIRVLN